MQAKKLDGSYGELIPFDRDGMETLFLDRNTESVEVFKATDAEIKNHNKYKIGKRFKKVPKIKKTGL